MRKLGWLAVSAAAITLSIYASTSVSGQQPALPRPYGTPPPLVITAFGGKEVTYKAPRTPWGEPDLQGVWSSDDMENVGIAAGGGRADVAAAALRGRCRCASRPPAAVHGRSRPFEARKKQVSSGASNRDRTGESSFRFDYGRRAFPQTRLLVDPADGRVPTLNPGLQDRGMPRGTYSHRQRSNCTGRTSRCMSAASRAASAARSCASSTATATASSRHRASSPSHTRCCPTRASSTSTTVHT